MNLKNILSDLHSRAYNHDGQPATIRLSNNLRIDFRIKEGIAVLLISRSSVFPSPVEWITVKRHWPYPIKKCGPDCPEKIVRGIGDLKSPIRHYLRCQWLLQLDLLQENTNQDLRQTDRSQSQPANV